MSGLVYRLASRYHSARLAKAIVRATFVAGAFGLALAGCQADDASIGASIATGQPASGTRLYKLDCGRIEILDLAVFDRGGAFDGRQASMVDPCFLIRHPDGDLLWDTGIDDALNDAPNGLLSDGMRFSVRRTLKGQLAELGLDADDIRYLALSHSHFDHVGNAGDFAAATWLVDEAERRFMFRDEARADAATFSLYSALEDADTIEFSEDYDVFRDGSVMILQTPGHTPGHTSLLVQLDETGPVLLSGDLYHLAEAREKRTIPVFNTDPGRTLRSMDRFESFAESTGALVIVQHDAEHFGLVPDAPAFLD